MAALVLHATVKTATVTITVATLLQTNRPNTPTTSTYTVAKQVIGAITAMKTIRSVAVDVAIHSYDGSIGTYRTDGRMRNRRISHSR